jgi:hypothetical protein
MALQSNKAIILFGAPVTKDQAVSQNLQDLGINLLRLRISDVQLRSHPTVVQPRYGIYVSNLPAYIEAMTFGREVNGMQPFYPITPPEDSSLLPFTWPDVAFDFTTKVEESLVTELEHALGQQSFKTVVKERRGNSYIAKIASWDQFKLLSSTPNINAITPAFTGTTNINGYKAFRAYQRLFQRLLSLHSYPAFVDADHLEEVKKFKADLFVEELIEIEDDDEMEDDGDEEESTSKGKKKKAEKIPKEKKWVGAFTKIDESRGKVPPQPAAEIIYIRDIDHLPPGSGLYAPYYADLHHHDNEMVPRVIDDYINGCLGEDEQECTFMSNTLRGYWGVFSKTDAGLEMSHLARCIDIALRTQARAIPYFCSSKGYAGCFVMGAGFEVTVGEIVRVPQRFTDLLDGFRAANTHERAIRTIVHMTGGVAYWADKSPNTMAGFRRYLLASPHLRVTDQDAIVQAARLLEFKEEPLKANATDVIRALSLLVSADPIPDDFPIHYTKIVTVDRTEVIWSGFGHFAPTFKVPGGRLTDLSTMETSNTTQLTKGGVKERLDVKRIGMKMIPLDLAIADLQWVKENKKIMSPFLTPGRKEKMSTEHFTRFIQAEGYNDVVGLLRKLSGTSAGSIYAGTKRKMEDASEGGGGASTSKRRNLLD